MGRFIPDFLWARERRAAHRRWWQQPAVIPVLALAAAPLQFADPPAPSSMLTVPWRTLGQVFLPTVELLLLPWIAWHVASAFTRERLTGGNTALALTALRPREIALCKTFAPAYLALLVFAGLIVLRMLSVVTQVFVSFGEIGWPRGVIFWEWNWAFWAREIWGDSRVMGAAPRGTAIPGTALATFLELLARATIWPLAFVTLVARCAAQSRSAWGAVVRAGALWAMAMAAALAVLAADAWFVYSPATRLFVLWGEAPLEYGLVAPLRLQVLMGVSLAIHWLLPLCWLVVWWRWTARGFAAAFLTASESGSQQT